jgi:VPDSG-CTERM motif
MIQIAGASDGQFSVLDVGSHAFLDGILKVVLLDDFVPEVDQTFAFLTYFIREGEFSHIANRNFGNIHWDVDFMDSEGFAVLTAKAGNVRAPDQGSTFVLLTLGLLGLVTYRRQLLRRQT